jgi:hypothetical protein
MGKISSTKKREITSHSLRVVMICFILLMGSFQVFAQSIDDKISVECNNESLPSALKKIEKASKFKYYSPTTRYNRTASLSRLSTRR